MYLSTQDFKTVVKSTPLVSIDLIIKNQQGQYLLGYRTNKPAQGYWFVPGGRILKDEPIDVAFTRLVKAELGVDADISNAHFQGVFEHFYDDSTLDGNVSTHYVVLGYELTLNVSLDSLPQEQHNDYQWFNHAELLSSDKVHVHSKWYLGKFAK